jgi:hypothetical protein
MKNKVCIKCDENKNVSDFYVGRNQCKKCRKLINKKYYEDNKECKKVYNKKYHEENKENILENKKKYREENKEKIKEYKKEYRENNKEKVKEYEKKYKEENKERTKEYGKKYRKKRIKNDPLFRLTDNIRKLIYKSFKNGGYTKKSRSYEILGCSFEDFKKHIESQFEDWMNWDNYGLYNGNECYGWDYDHIIPLSSCECEEDVYKLNHYSNLQPLCSYINRYVKRDNLDWEL